MLFPSRTIVKGRHIGVHLAAALAVLGVAASSKAAALPVSLVASGITTQGNYGTIKGRLVWGGDSVPAPKNLVDVGQSNLASKKDPAVCARSEPIPDNSLVVDPRTKGVKYAFAYVVKPQGANPDAVKAAVGKQAKVEIDQKNCEFIPYCTALIQDQGLVLKSSDPVNHNVRFSAFTNAPFNQILPPNGQVELKVVAERRPIPLACDIHPWMKGYLMVFDHPFFAVTGEDGSFEITGVPAGAQKVILWQETVGYATPGAAAGQPVTVTAGQTTDIGEVKLVPKK